MTMNRRRLLGQIATGVAALQAAPFLARAQSQPQVVIVGAGSGGATVAAYLRRLAPDIAVTLIERNPAMTTGAYSNHVITGLKPIEQVTHSYDRLSGRGIKLVQAVAIDVDATKKIVTMLDGSKIPYDRLVLSPGIDIKYDGIEGYGPWVPKIIPHAWRGAEQTLLLRSQLDALGEGETVLMTIPAEPFSCPPAAYERMCLIAHVLKTRKPRSKLIVLDANRSFAMQDVFRAAMATYYSGVIEFVPSNETASFEVSGIDQYGKTVRTKSGISFKAAVINLIAPQAAGGIALRAGCVEADWCPVDPETFLSRRVSDIYVIGDCAVATPMPKSASSANSQAKRVANHLATTLGGKATFAVNLRDAAWFHVAPDDCIKSGAGYAVGQRDGRKELVGSGVFQSAAGDDVAERRANVEEAAGWYAGITSDMLATAG